MSNLANIKGAGAVQQKKDSTSTLLGLLNRPDMKAQIATALPKHIDADRMIRIATTEIRKTPELADCNQTSFLGAVVQCSQLGLEPGGALGHAYLLPFGNGNASDGKKNIQLIIGYRGMIDLARRSGQIMSISARVVRKSDEFSFSYGLEESLIHNPGDDDEAEITHVYAVAKLKDGGVQFEVMTTGQVEKVRMKSPAGKKGPWVSYWEEMAKKTVIRRLFKYLPVSIEMQTAVSIDEKGEAGIEQNNASIITGEYSVLEDSINSTSKTTPVMNMDTGEIIEPANQKQNVVREEKKEERTPEQILADFTKKISTLDSIPEVEKCYVYVREKLTNNPSLLESATDVYELHKIDLQNAIQDQPTDDDLPL